MTEGGGRRTSRSDSYMEQENEWEREGLLDPAWEQQQKKVRYFTEFDKMRPHGDADTSDDPAAVVK